MGGRLSRPRSSDGLTELPKPSSSSSSQKWRYGNINSRTIAAPLAALTMASLLYVYTRISIRAAKLNAQKHREADGGQLSWYKEGLRQHGAIEKVEEKGTFREALLGSEPAATAVPASKEDLQARRHSEQEEKLSKFLGKDSGGK